MTTNEVEKMAVKEIMDKSGNGFHSRVVRLLREQKWEVLVSPYYSDNFTDKPREIDILARREFNVKDFIGRWLGTLDVRLFVECKYITGDTVFWFDDKDKARATEKIMADTGMEHPNQDGRIKQLHYFADVPVAKLFASEKSRGDEYEPMGKAINQNLNALVYYRGKGDLMPENPHREIQVLQQLAYPLIVVNSFEHFYRTSMNDGTGTLERITEPFQLEVNYAYMSREKSSCNEYFLIDVVSFDTLPAFLARLEETDVGTISEHLRWEERRKQSEQQNRTEHRGSAIY